ncbi:MAG: CpaF family protein [Anaerolineae bacterium]
MTLHSSGDGRPPVDRPDPPQGQPPTSAGDETAPVETHSADDLTEDAPLGLLPPRWLRRPRGEPLAGVPADEDEAAGTEAPPDDSRSVDGGEPEPDSVFEEEEEEEEEALSLPDWLRSPPRPSRPPGRRPPAPPRPGGPGRLNDRPAPPGGVLRRVEAGHFEHMPDTEEGIRERVAAALAADLGPADLLSINDPDFTARVRQRIGELFDIVLRDNRVEMRMGDRAAIRRRVMDDLVGFGPLQPLIDDPEVTEITVVGHECVYAQRGGRRSPADVRFSDADHLMRVIMRLADLVEQRLNESHPCLHARLPDRSWLTVMLPPIAADGATLTLRKAQPGLPLTIHNLADTGTASIAVLTFLRACVLARLNIVICGGSGSGRTTLLNALLAAVPEDEMVVLVEDFPEIVPPAGLQVRLTSQEIPAVGISPGGPMAATQHMLIEHAFRMAPDRIVVGEVYGQEVHDLTQMARVSFGCWMTTVYGISPGMALDRLALICGSRPGMAAHNIRAQVANAVDVVVHLARLGDGSRRVMAVTEVLGLDGEDFATRDVFVFEQTGVDPASGRLEGRHMATGYVPRAVQSIAAAGLTLPSGLFDPPA